MTQTAIEIPGEVAESPRPSKVFFYIEVPEDALTPQEVWPHGAPENWTLADVVAELRLQYGDSISLSRLSADWCIGGFYGGATLHLRDDTGNRAEIGLNS